MWPPFFWFSFFGFCIIYCTLASEDAYGSQDFKDLKQRLGVPQGGHVRTQLHRLGVALKKQIQGKPVTSIIPEVTLGTWSMSNMWIKNVNKQLAVGISFFKKCKQTADNFFDN